MPLTHATAAGASVAGNDWTKTHHTNTQKCVHWEYQWTTQKITRNKCLKKMSFSEGFVQSGGCLASMWPRVQYQNVYKCDSTSWTECEATRYAQRCSKSKECVLDSSHATPTWTMQTYAQDYGAKCKRCSCEDRCINLESSIAVIQPKMGEKMGAKVCVSDMEQWSSYLRLRGIHKLHLSYA